MNIKWTRKKISDVAFFRNNKRVPLKSLDREKRQGEYPYYGASGIVDYIDDYIFDGTFLLISEDGDNLRTRNTPIAFKATGKFWVNNHAHILEEKEPGILDYLEYYFSVLDINPYITGAAQPKLNKANLDMIEIPVPEKDERLLLNKILNALTDKININTQINQTLEAMAQAIFKSWFVDFDPVRAKMAVLENGGTKEEAERAAMMAISGKDEAGLDCFKQENPEAYAELAQTAALFPSAMQDSELGLIPEGWDLSTIGDEVTVVGGGTPSTQKSEFWKNGEIYWTTPKDLSNVPNKILIDTDKRITKAGLKCISSGLLPVDTVLMSSRAPVGYLALAKIELAINQGYIAMICHKNLSNVYVLQWCQHNMDEIKQRASGTTFAEISKKNFKPMIVIVPNNAILCFYSKQVKNIYEIIETNVREMSALADCRDVLLPKLLNGEICL